MFGVQTCFAIKQEVPPVGIRLHEPPVEQLVDGAAQHKPGHVISNFLRFTRTRIVRTSLATHTHCIRPSEGVLPLLYNAGCAIRHINMCNTCQKLQRKFAQVWHQIAYVGGSGEREYLECTYIHVPAKISPEAWVAPGPQGHQGPNALSAPARHNKRTAHRRVVVVVVVLLSSN